MKIYLILAAFVLALISPFYTTAQTTSEYLFYIDPANEGDPLADGSLEHPWSDLKIANQTDFPAESKIFFKSGSTVYGGLKLTPKDTVRLIDTYGGTARATLITDNDPEINGIEDVRGSIDARDIGNITVQNLIVKGKIAPLLFGEGVYYVNPATPNDTIFPYVYGDTVMLNPAAPIMAGISFLTTPASPDPDTEAECDWKFENINIYNIDASNFVVAGIRLEAAPWKCELGGYKNINIFFCDLHDNLEGGITGYARWDEPTDRMGIEDVTIKYCNAYNNTGNPAILWQPTGSGIAFGGFDGVLVEYCNAYENGVFNRGPSGPVGIWTYYSNNVTFRHCESHHNEAYPLDGGGFDFDNGVTNSVMEYNYSHDNAGPGYLTSQFCNQRRFANNTIRYNISQDDAYHDNNLFLYGSMSFWTCNGAMSENLTLHNNTIYKSVGSGGALRIDEKNFSNMKVFNNIFVTKNTDYVMLVHPGADVQLMGNNYWTPDDTLEIRWGNPYWLEGMKYFHSVAEWSDSSGQEKLNGENIWQSADPLLYNMGGGTTIENPFYLDTLSAYHLQLESSMRDAGINPEEVFGINPGNHDYYGNLVAQGCNYDIGAHEVLLDEPGTVQINNMTVQSGQDITIDTPRRVFGKIVVKSGAKLHITNTYLRFMTETSGIIVKKGGQLWVEDAKLTNVCDAWAGIRVEGDRNICHPVCVPNCDSYPNHGFVYLDNARIENAINGVSAPGTVSSGTFPPINPLLNGTLMNQLGGGIVHATDSYFYNCAIGISLGAYNGCSGNNTNRSVIKGCTFEFVNPWENQYFQRQDDDFIGISLNQSGSGIFLEDNTFIGSPVLNPYHGTGILIKKSSVSVGSQNLPNHFSNLYQGIYINNTGSTATYPIHCSYNILNQCDRGITLYNAPLAVLDFNQINVHAGTSALCCTYGIYTYKGGGFDILNNEILTNATQNNQWTKGMVVVQSNAVNTSKKLYINNNRFEGAFTAALELLGDNRNSDLSCNGFFGTPQTDWNIDKWTEINGSSNADLDDQGLCGSDATALFSTVWHTNANNTYPNIRVKNLDNAVFLRHDAASAPLSVVTSGSYTITPLSCAGTAVNPCYNELTNGENAPKQTELSVNHSMESMAQISPNPNRGQFNIVLPSTAEQQSDAAVHTVQVFSAQGVLLMTRTAATGQTLSLDLSDILPAGVYYCTIPEIAFKEKMVVIP
ncbi:MAG: T9SS type A sorting domain-containing protein [Sphingobacteriales bacterium]|nr:T9SS type A sorting domain-containing protein [Sphingobacteriales bacterium]